MQALYTRGTGTPGRFGAVQYMNIFERRQTGRYITLSVLL
jgi:hypothetical protein